MKKLCMTLVLVLLNTGSLLASVEINLARKVVVDSEYMKLSDIASIRGENAVKINKVFLGPSPRNGTSETFLRSDILERLRGLGLGNEVTFTGSLGTSVSRNSGNTGIATASDSKVAQELLATTPKKRDVAVVKNKIDKKDYIVKAQKAAAVDLIRAAIKDFVAGKINSDLQIVMHTKLNKFDLDGNIGTKARVEGVERGKIPGHATLAVVFSSDSQVSGYASVDVNIDMDAQVMVLARSVKKGDIIRAQDLVLKNVSYKPDLILENVKPQDIVGTMALKNVRSGVPVSAAYFGKPLDVEKGQMVTVLVKGKGFLIKEMALALNSGNTGDTIKVESVVNKSVYPVRVTGRNKADMPINAL